MIPSVCPSLQVTILAEARRGGPCAGQATCGAGQRTVRMGAEGTWGNEDYCEE